MLASQHCKVNERDSGVWSIHSLHLSVCAFLIAEQGEERSTPDRELDSMALG